MQLLYSTVNIKYLANFIYINKMTNLEKQTQSPSLSTFKIYLREADGTYHLATYSPNRNLLEIIRHAYKDEQLQNWQLIYKRRFLSLQNSFQWNNIEPNSVINIFRGPSKSQLGLQCVAFISHQNKLYQIAFDKNDSVEEFKKNIEKETMILAEKQILLYKGQFLQGDKKLKDYNIKNEDIIKMGTISDHNNEQDPAFLSRNRIFPVNLNGRNRRGSDYGSTPLNETNTQTIQGESKFSKSDVFISKQNDFELSNYCNFHEVPGFLGSSSQFSEEDADLQLKTSQDFNTEGIEVDSNSPLLKLTFNQSKLNPIEDSIQKEKVKKAKEFNIFSDPNNVYTKKLNLKLSFPDAYDDGQLNFESSIKFIQQSDKKQPPSLQAALEQLMNPSTQQVVFCQSYYEKQGEQNQLRTSSQMLIKSNCESNPESERRKSGSVTNSQEYIYREKQISEQNIQETEIEST